MTDERLRLLPVQIRPQAGEGIRAFIVRLANANHLPPRYLRTYLCEPPRHLGLPSFGRLAVVTGRDAEILRITLETKRCLECGAAMPPLGILGRQALRCSQTLSAEGIPQAKPPRSLAQSPLQALWAEDAGPSRTASPTLLLRLPTGRLPPAEARAVDQTRAGRTPLLSQLR